MGQNCDKCEIPAKTFVSKFEEQNGKHLPFNICTLKAAIQSSCLAQNENKKPLALFFYNGKDNCKFLIGGEIRKILEQRFFFLGWSISKDSDFDTIKEMLHEYENLQIVDQKIRNKCSILFIIIAANGTPNVFTTINNFQEEENTLSILNTVAETFLENQRCDDNSNTHAVNSKTLQQSMFNMLGDRDYDFFNENEHDYLKKKIGYAYFWTAEEYSDQENKTIEKTYQKICDEAGEFSPKGHITISFIYNCLEPLEKSDTDSDQQCIGFVPVFVLRKCIHNKEACRVFIDHDLRVYNTWKEYMYDNKLGECVMVLPKDGRYQGDEHGNVVLERKLSSSAKLSEKVLYGLDITNSVVGMGAVGVTAVAAIPAVAVAPFVLIGAGVVGGSTMLYGLIRSSMQIHDKRIRKEDLSICNSDARGAYINIGASCLGILSMGGTVALTHLVSKGVQITQAAEGAVNAVRFANIGFSGVGIVHPAWDIIERCVNNEQPSAISWIQLTTSILFFGHAVCSFEMAGTTIRQTQQSILQDYLDSLGSNRLRKMFNKLLLETKSQQGNDVAASAEVIAVLNKIPNKDEFFATLVRSNKLFNKENVKFAASEGQLTLNGVPVDIFQFGSLAKAQKVDFLANLESQLNVTVKESEVSFMRSTIQKLMNPETLIKVNGLLTASPLSFSKILHLFAPEFKELIVKALDELLQFLNVKFNLNPVEALSRFLSQSVCLTLILKFVLNFLKKKSGEMEQDYLNKLNEAKALPNFNKDKFNESYKINPVSLKNGIAFVEKLLNIMFNDGKVVERIIAELASSFLVWFTSLIADYEQREEKKNTYNTPDKNKYVKCKICGGKYYKK